MFPGGPEGGPIQPVSPKGMFLSVLTAPHDLAEATDLRTLLSAMPMTDPEYGAFQASSVYFNAAMGALGAIGDVAGN